MSVRLHLRGMRGYDVSRAVFVIQHEKGYFFPSFSSLRPLRVSVMLLAREGRKEAPSIVALALASGLQSKLELVCECERWPSMTCS